MLGALRRQRVRDVEAELRLRAAEEVGRDAQRAAADRAHEMRNIVTGLAGAAYLLAEDAAALPDRAELATALRAELDRLSRMLDAAPIAPQSPGVEGFAVVTVLNTVVAVRRAAGGVIQLDAPPDLRAHGSAEAFAQVVTNLLVNCSRHAPGAPVRVTARECDGRISVRVVDSGPGITPGTEALVLRRGHRSARTGGSGLGLHISATLMREQGGDLRLPPVRPGSGFAVELELPAVQSSQPVPAASQPRSPQERLPSTALGREPVTMTRKVS